MVIILADDSYIIAMLIMYHTSTYEHIFPKVSSHKHWMFYSVFRL